MTALLARTCCANRGRRSSTTCAPRARSPRPSPPKAAALVQPASAMCSSSAGRARRDRFSAARSPGRRLPRLLPRRSARSRRCRCCEIAAPSAFTLSMMKARFSSSSGFGSSSGELAVGLPIGLDQFKALRSRIGPTIGPAIPLPPSRTTRRPLIAFGSTKRMTASSKPRRQLGALLAAATRCPPETCLDLADGSSSMPASPERGSAPRPTSSAPSILRRVVRSGADNPTVQPARSDQPVEEIGRGLARVPDVHTNTHQASI